MKTVIQIQNMEKNISQIKIIVLFKIIKSKAQDIYFTVQKLQGLILCF